MPPPSLDDSVWGYNALPSSSAIVQYRLVPTPSSPLRRSRRPSLRPIDPNYIEGIHQALVSWGLWSPTPHPTQLPDSPEVEGLWQTDWTGAPYRRHPGHISEVGENEEEAMAPPPLSAISDLCNLQDIEGLAEDEALPRYAPPPLLYRPPVSLPAESPVHYPAEDDESSLLENLMHKAFKMIQHCVTEIELLREVRNPLRNQYHCQQT